MSMDVDMDVDKQGATMVTILDAETHISHHPRTRSIQILPTVLSVRFFSLTFWFSFSFSSSFAHYVYVYVYNTVTFNCPIPLDAPEALAPVPC